MRDRAAPPHPGIYRVPPRASLLCRRGILIQFLYTNGGSPDFSYLFFMKEYSETSIKRTPNQADSLYSIWLISIKVHLKVFHKVQHSFFSFLLYFHNNMELNHSTG